MRGERLWSVMTGLLCLAAVDGFATGPEVRVHSVGSIAGKGTILVNNQLALPGTTVFAGDVISTGKSSTAVMNLRSGTSATVSENSEVALSPGADSNLNLRKGALVVRNAGRHSTRVSVLGASVLVVGEASFPAICKIASVGRSAAVISERGRVEIHGAGAPLILAPGKYAKLEAGRAQGAGQQAGKVSSAIPDEVVQRQGVGAEIMLQVNDPVNWNDVVRTLRTGRLRIELLEGSLLNVGARSVMRITKHDPQTQQTELELTLGRLRGEVVKISKAGGTFQVRTQTAVIGVVGTVFLIQAAANLTRVHCIEGVLTVQNINPAVIGQVTLRAGDFTSVSRGIPPTGAVRSTPSQVQAELNQTNVQPTTSTAAGQPAGGGQAGTTAGQTAGTTGAQTATTAANTATSAATAGLSATSSVLSGVAVTEVGDATTILTETQTTLESAQTSSASAASTASTATTTSQAVSTGTQTVEQKVSPAQ